MSNAFLRRNTEKKEDGNYFQSSQIRWEVEGSRSMSRKINKGFPSTIFLSIASEIDDKLPFDIQREEIEKSGRKTVGWLEMLFMIRHHDARHAFVWRLSIHVFPPFPPSSVQIKFSSLTECEPLTWTQVEKFFRLCVDHWVRFCWLKIQFRIFGQLEIFCSIR